MTWRDGDDLALWREYCEMTKNEEPDRTPSGPFARASWRDLPPTPKQAYRIKKWQDDGRISSKDALEGLKTRGAAADLIDKTFKAGSSGPQKRPWWEWENDRDNVGDTGEFKK